jgi:hypothetical protein
MTPPNQVSSLAGLSGQVQPWKGFSTGPLPSSKRGVLHVFEELGPYLPEVVWVYGQFRLLDAESYQRAYSRKSGRPLTKGYYIVSWPTGRAGNTFGEDAVFHGPYPSRRDAECSLESFQSVLQRPLRKRPAPRRTTPKQEPPIQNWVVRETWRASRQLYSHQY